MLQIPLTADLHFPKGEAPVLEFQDVMEAEKFVTYLQKQIKILRGTKKRRLEYFSDGIYFDGELLEIRGRKFAILKAFEFVDRLSKIDLIEKVWGNPLTNEKTIENTIYQFNKVMMEKYNIFLSLYDGYYTIHRPS